MFAARLRSSLTNLFQRRCFSSLTRNCEIVTNSKRILHSRFNGGVNILNSLRLSVNGVTLHSSPQYYSASESDTEVDAKAPESVTSLEDDFLAELGSIVVEENPTVTVLQLLTEKSESLEVEIPMLPQEAIGKKIKKETKKHGQDSDLKLKLLTEKPEVFWKTDVKRKIKACGSTPPRNVKDLNVSSSKPKSLEVTIPMLPQEAIDKKKKHGQVSDLKLKLLTEKPEVFWKTDVKRKIKACANENPTITILQLLTEKPNSHEVEIPMLPQEAVGKESKYKKETKKKKHGVVSDLKLKLLTEKPEVFLKTDVKRKIKAPAKDPAPKVLQLLTEKPKPLEVEIPMLPQEAIGKKKKETHGQVSDLRLKLLPEMPEVLTITDLKRKIKARGSIPARNVNDSNVSPSKPSKSLSPTGDQKSKTQKKVSPGSEAKKQTSSKSSSTSNTLLNGYETH